MEEDDIDLDSKVDEIIEEFDDLISYKDEFDIVDLKLLKERILHILGYVELIGQEWEGLKFKRDNKEN